MAKTSVRVKTFVGTSPQELDDQVNEFIRKEVQQLVSSEVNMHEGKFFCHIKYRGDSERSLFDPQYRKGERQRAWRKR